ncbi:MAG: tyrosine--tRNA ligase [Armatimonadota bacterium]|nr:tyrosine--tRNA ligase [bacterium]
MTIYEDLKWRDIIFQSSDSEAISELLAKPGQPLYCGFDPTAASLHIGSLLPLLTLRRFQLAGHKPIALVGGATGLIGDPSGKASERTLNTKEVVDEYVQGIRAQIERILDPSGSTGVQVVNNYDWFAPITAIEFLRDVGKHFSVNKMIAKDSVSSRIERDEVGISYTEFSYMLLQAYDFYHLCKEFDCKLQVGGADQWGNMTAGIELVRRKLSQQAYCLTFPLVTNAAGQKFGKSEAGAIWLDAERTSPYTLYQYFVNTDDRDVVKYLKFFTLLCHEEIEDLIHKVETEPERREAQRKLAYEVTSIIHGGSEADKVVAASQALFGDRSLADTDPKTLLSAVESAPTLTYDSVDALPNAMQLVVDSGLIASKSEARRQISSGGVYINNERVSDIDFCPKASDFIHGTLMLLRRGKKNYAVVRLKDK